MSKSANLFFAVLSAVSFYFVFGICVADYMVTDAYRTIAPAIKVVAAVLSMGTIALAVWRLAREPASRCSA